MGVKTSARPEHVEGPVEGLEPLGHPTENCELKTENYPVTDTDIINYEIARLIREETNDGYAIAEFLTRIMHGSSPGELAYSLRDRVISAADRMAAAKELLNRGFGRLGQTRRAARQDDSDLVRSGLARYIRERTDHGLEAARLLLDAASGEDDSFSMRQRVAATRELIRRGWDTNYEAVTPADIVAYYERQDALEPTEYDDRLQEWQEQERAAQTAGATGRSSEDEPPQPDSGLFSHLTNAEINLYESMSAQEQTEFIEQQRARRARSQAEAGAVQPEAAAATPAKRVPVSEQGAGIHTPNTQDDLIPAESDEATDEPDQRLGKHRLEHPNPRNHHPVPGTTSCASRSFPRPQPLKSCPSMLVRFRIAQRKNLLRPPHPQLRVERHRRQKPPVSRIRAAPL